MIKLTNTLLPNRKLLDSYIDRIYEQQIVTNNGPLVKELESKINEFLKTENTILVNSGHTALMMALKLIPPKSKIITTPFTFISTLNAILWNRHIPVFADICPNTLCMDHNQIENLLNIHKDVNAIVATHIFNNICDVDAFKNISKRYDIPVIYDAAHSFGIQKNGKSVFEFGDISAVSFQAYKSFHCVEGGALFTSNEMWRQKLFNMRYFGLDIDLQPQTIGLNGKNSEVHAAFGLCNLLTWDDRLKKRKKNFYDLKDFLSKYPVQTIEIKDDIQSNYGYFPIILQDSKTRMKMENHLFSNGIQSKRYFQPSLNRLEYLDIMYQEMHISESIAERILCIPVHSELSSNEIEHITSTLSTFNF